MLKEGAGAAQHLLPLVSTTGRVAGCCQANGEHGDPRGKTPSSAEKRSWEGIRRFGLADFGTWREDRGVEHLVSLFPFLPASDYPHLAFLPSEQTPRELTRCRGGGCRAAVDV